MDPRSLRPPARRRRRKGGGPTVLDAEATAAAKRRGRPKDSDPPNILDWCCIILCGENHHTDAIQDAGRVSPSAVPQLLPLISARLPPLLTLPLLLALRLSLPHEPPAA
jgi:hypothetical protein